MTEPMRQVSVRELCQFEDIEIEIVIEIVEYGIAMPLTGVAADEWIFDTGSVHWIKKAVRLHRDLEIDWVAVALVIDLIQQKELLERENLRYQQQLNRFIGE